MKPRHSLLIVDDEPQIRRLIQAALARADYATIEAQTAREALDKLRSERPDITLLDLGLPDRDGLELVPIIKKESDTTLIIVSARDATDEKVAALDLGADDYLTKPFEPRELLVRIRNLLRRPRVEAAAPADQSRYAVFGPWRLDLLQRRLIAPDDRLVMLSSAEFRLLSRFIEEPNVVLARETLLPERRATAAFDRTIDLQVSRLRQKLAGATGGGDLILTVRGEGYVLASPVRYE